MYLKIKRLFDVVLSLFLIIILIPFFILIIILLKIDGIKNPIYKQERTGKDNIKFIIYKFRTIKSNEISSFCSFLRKTGIDELLQLFNILKGDMSFIGPRPWILEYEKYYNDIQRNRLKVLPGLTGYAQINNCNDIFDKIDKDLYYVNNICLKLDLFIIINTIIFIFKGNKNEFNKDDIKNEILLLKRGHYEK